MVVRGSLRDRRRSRLAVGALLAVTFVSACTPTQTRTAAIGTRSEPIASEAAVAVTAAEEAARVPVAADASDALTRALERLGLLPPPELFEPVDGAPYAITITRNHEIRLDDGRVLRADLYLPADPVTRERAPGAFPVVVGMTPYGKTLAPSTGGMAGASGLNLDLVRNGYIGAVVDVPGTGGSEGEFNLFDHDEAVAGAAIVRWAAAVEGSNGKVGMLGESYSAIVQLFTAAEVGPGSPLKALFPLAATADPYRDLFTSGGALNVMSPLGLFFGYGLTRSFTPLVERADNPVEALKRVFANFGRMSSFEGVMAQQMLTNGERRYRGAWWDERAPVNVLQRIADNDVAVYLVGGLYDVFQRGEPLLYSGLQNAAAGRPVEAPMAPDQVPSGKYQLLTGPWHHGNLGAGLDLAAIQLAWFDRWLKDVDNGIDRTGAPMHVVEPGGATYDTATYPLADAQVQRLWLREGRALTEVAPSGDEVADRILFTGIGPLCSQSTVQFAAGLFAENCPNDYERAESELGATTYSTPVLDEPLRLAGPITLTLRASSTRPDALFAVTIEDVGPDGRSRDVTGGAQLGSMRAIDEQRSWPGPDGAYLRPHHLLTYEAREPVPAGEVVRYDIEVRPAFATIPAGHRLRLRIATADFPHLIPLADGPQLGGGWYSLEHSAEHPSFVDVSTG